MKIDDLIQQIEREIAESLQLKKDRAKIIAERVVRRMNEKTSDVDNAVKSYLEKGGKVEKLPTKKPRKSEKTDFSSKHIGGKGEVGKGKANRIGKSAKTDPSGKPVVTAEAIAKLESIRDSINEQIRQLQEFHNIPQVDSKSPISGGHVRGCMCKEVKEGLRDPKDNPCWKGYKPVGTKQKGGRTVPNCVPKESVRVKTEDVAGKVTAIRPGQAAEIDHGNGTKTTIDLKKNPAALTKDAEGKLVLNPKSQGTLGAGGQQTTNDPNAPKVGDEVEIAAKENADELTLIRKNAGLK